MLPIKVGSGQKQYVVIKEDSFKLARWIGMSIESNFVSGSFKEGRKSIDMFNKALKGNFYFDKACLDKQYKNDY